jgi:hypothetical protein
VNKSFPQVPVATILRYALLALVLSACSNGSGDSTPPQAPDVGAGECAAMTPLEDQALRQGRVPAGRTLIVIGQSGTQRVADFARGTGVEPAGAMWYVELFSDEDSLRAQLDDIEREARDLPGLVYQIGLSFGAISTPTLPRGALVAAGNYDRQIEILGDWIKRQPTIVYLRPGYEFDLLGGQYGPAPVYQAAYRRVADVLRSRCVHNLQLVWHSAGAFWRALDYSGAVGTIGGFDRPDVLARIAAGLLSGSVIPVDDLQPIAAFYPGDGYVDAFAISYWGDACCFGPGSAGAKAAYEQRTRELLDEARAMRLPLMIGESTPVYVGADSGAASVAWIDGYFDLIEEYDIGLASLISYDWTEGGFFASPIFNGYWPDARIQDFDDTRAALLRRIATERYVFRR